MAIKLVDGNKKENEWMKAVVGQLENTIDYIKKAGNADGIAVVITHTDGTVSTTYSASNDFHMVGGLEYMKQEIMNKETQ